jgi:hypothetical protein
MVKSFVVIVLALCFGSAIAADKDHDEPKHGGVVLEVGEEVAHLELVHDAKAGKVTLYITGPDAKTDLALKDAPKINLKTKDGNKQIETKAISPKDGASAHFEAIDDVLKADPLKGRIALVINGKKFNVELKDDHAHKK